MTKRLLSTFGIRGGAQVREDFMVFVRGVAVCPFAADDAEETGLWLAKNDPRPSGPLPGERPPAEAELGIDEEALEACLRKCRSPRLEEELGLARSAAGRLAIVEDSLHHEREAWASGAPRGGSLRKGAAPAIRLSLPFSGSAYRGARPADAPWTRPSSASAGSAPSASGPLDS